MYSLDFDITIGGYRLTMLESVTVKAGVENLADTAVVVLPATVYNKALEIEGKSKRGMPLPSGSAMTSTCRNFRSSSRGTWKVSPPMTAA